MAKGNLLVRKINDYTDNSKRSIFEKLTTNRPPPPFQSLESYNFAKNRFLERSFFSLGKGKF